MVYGLCVRVNVEGGGGWLGNVSPAASKKLLASSSFSSGSIGFVFLDDSTNSNHQSLHIHSYRLCAFTSPYAVT